jgi:hypothetical protein
VLNVSVVYRLQIVDNDSQDLRTSSKSGQKSYHTMSKCFSQLQLVKVHTVLDRSTAKKVACSDPVWRIIICSPALVSLRDNLCMERLR